MDQFDDVVCELRYCPECGTEIFCKTDPAGESLYFISEAMDNQVEACPECRFDLTKIPIHVFDEQPKPSDGKKLRRDKTRAGIRRLADEAFEKAPEIFPSKSTANKAIRAIGGALFDLLSSGVDVRWPGIGSLKIRERKSRRGRNPVTGEIMQIPAKKGIRFFPSKALREKLDP
jgi:DNA-binding protein HU-beta